MIAISNLKLQPGEDEARLKALAAKALRIPEGRIQALTIRKKSLDARKKDELKWIYTVGVTVDGDEGKLLAKCKQASIVNPYHYDIPKVSSETRPVVVGFGPAGMFAALVLAYAGARPIVLERGQDVDARTAQVESFRAGGAFDPENNVQFGEGGAGTFSDGKLNTGTHDSRIRWVLEQFAAHGAPEHICWDAKPHIGTDVLVHVVKAIREDVIAHGGEVRFGHRLTGLEMQDGALTALTVAGPEGAYSLPAAQAILAVGHSARDTFGMLHETGLPMTRKPFSMGVRIEHRQEMIDLAQYGRARGDELPPADYGLHVKLEDGASAYTFCMCPGGEVFAAASEEGGVVTNGMSRSDRGGENANSALLVTLQPEDFPGEGVLAGMEWQREIERKAFRYAGGDYKAPAQTVGDFLQDRPSTGPGGVQPTYLPGVFWGDLRQVLPEKITDVLVRAIPALGQKLRGFDAPDAVLTGPETRSSSPVRVVRGADLCSEGLAGLYPCGEGAGYAGGITSAAVDGMRCAEAVLNMMK